jgi:glycosyltransferase involved in cell wall biosynthesis
MKNPEAGGAEVHFHEIFKRIAAMGHSVTLVSHNFSGGLREETVDGIRIMRTGNKYLFHYQFKRLYLRELKHLDYDLVVDDISKIPLNTPDYVDKPLVGIIHHLHGKTLYRELPFPMAHYIYRKEQQIPVHYHSTPIFAVSPSTQRELISIGQPEEKTALLYNAIDHELFDSAPVTKSETPIISYIGRVKKYKNLEMIIDALPVVAENIPDVRLEIGGKGDHLDTLEAYARKKGIRDRVDFLGFIPEEDKPAVMGRAWLFVTMAQKEGWGITVIEANAAGTPVIGSDVPGLRDSIVDGKTGVLIPYGDSAALADTLIMLLNDRERIRTMSDEAKQWAQKYTWEASAEQFITCVREWYPDIV